MHEVSLCQAIRETLEARARVNGLRAVHLVRLEIGRFAAVDRQALDFAFDAVMRGSVAEGARLIVINLPGRAMCYDCHREVEIEARLDPCPLCGGGALLPIAGDTLRIKDMEGV